MELNQKKLYQCKGIKVDDQGKVSLVFGTMNVIDHDGDVTLPGAIGEPQKVRMSAYNHSSWGNALPVGKGIVYEKGDDMLYEGQFFLNTVIGKETYETVKAMEDLQEYSYGFDIKEASYGQFGPDNRDVRFLKGLKIFEVSPVLLGAGIDTRTLAIKEQGKASVDAQISAHIARVYGEAAAKKLAALIQDELVLNGTGGSIDNLGTIDVTGTKSKTYAEHAELLLAAVEDFVKRSQSIADLRAEKGKDPASEQNHGRLLDIAKALTDAADGLLAFTMDDDKEANQQAALLLEEHDTRELMRGSTSGT